MPVPRKPAERRQRRNTPELGQLAVVPAAASVVPDAPPRWLAATKDAWGSWWSGPMAAYIEPSSDAPVVLRCFDLLDQAERLERQGRKDTLVKGSTGQPSLNPLLKHAQSLRDEARRDEAVIGRGPKRRLDLGIKLGDAVRSLDEVNRRLVDGDSDEDEVAGPRFGAVDTQAREA